MCSGILVVFLLLLLAGFVLDRGLEECCGQNPALLPVLTAWEGRSAEPHLPCCSSEWTVTEGNWGCRCCEAWKNREILLSLQNDREILQAELPGTSLSDAQSTGLQWLTSRFSKHFTAWAQGRVFINTWSNAVLHPCPALVSSLTTSSLWKGGGSPIRNARTTRASNKSKTCSFCLLSDWACGYFWALKDGEKCYFLVLVCRKTQLLMVGRCLSGSNKELPDISGKHLLYLLYTTK